MTAATQRVAPPLYRHVVADTRRALTLTEIADVTGVGTRAVQKWASGSTKPEGTSRDRLLELSYVVEQIGDVYDNEGIEIWLHAPQRAFDGKSALDLLRDGRFEDVIALVDRLVGGPRR